MVGLTAMGLCRVAAVLPLLLAAVHAGDELNEAARRERLTRLRSRAAMWYASRKSVVSNCPRCQGAGKVTETVVVAGRPFGEVVTCPSCYGGCKVVLEKHYRKVFFEMMTPRHRSEPGRSKQIDDGFKAACRGTSRPDALDRWVIERVELADATHGIVWTKLNGEKKPTPMRWIRTDESNGKPEWFVYDETTDGRWLGRWDDRDGAGLKEIDWEEWFRRAEGACAKGTTTLAKMEALQDEAAKIVDVEPSDEGAKIVVCKEWGGPWRATVDVAMDDLPLVRDWGRWDRLTWRVRVVVNGVARNDMRADILWDGPDSAVWSKNPGLVGCEIDPAEPSSFPKWCAKFDAADATGRKEMIEQVQGKTLVDEAKVLEVLVGHLRVQFESGEPVTFPLEDPQAAEEVQVGDTIVVARWPDYLGVAGADVRKEYLRFRYGVLERSPSRRPRTDPWPRVTIGGFGGPSGLA